MAFVPADQSSPPDDAEAYVRAKKIVYDRLAERQRSRAELGRALERRDVPAAIASQVLDRCEAAGLVDDAEFAREWIAARRRGKGLAKRALAAELSRYGISDQIVRDALDEIDPADERGTAEQLVERKLASTAHLAEAVRARRLVGVLVRKGYRPSVAQEVVSAALSSEVARPDPAS